MNYGPYGYYPPQYPHPYAHIGQAFTGPALPGQVTSPLVPQRPATPIRADAADEEPPKTITQMWVEAIPAILLFGVTTGAAFAIGSGVVNRWVLPK